MRLVYLCMSVFAFACQKESQPANTGLEAQNYFDVSYGPDAQQKMDVYLPAGRTTTSTKVMVLIHGGAWSSGDKTDFAPFVDTLKRRLPDYAIFNINYRLASGTQNLFPTQENDVKAAVEFVYNKRTEYKISDKFVLLGASAGGHLALLQAYKNNTTVNVKAVVDFFGPTDMTAMYTSPASPLVPPSAVASIVGATPSSNPTLYQQSSPINFIAPQSPPTMILHGGMDPLVSPSQSVTLNDRLQASGVVHQYIFYPTESHGWTGVNLTNSFNAIAAFLAANVN
jgi:acetyl esterase/lipase